jgi:hypothetical protein
MAGFMSSASTIGGLLSPITIGWAFHHWQNWNAALLVTVAAPAIAAVLWIAATAATIKVRVAPAGELG